MLLFQRASDVIENSVVMHHCHTTIPSVCMHASTVVAKKPGRRLGRDRFITCNSQQTQHSGTQKHRPSFLHCIKSSEVVCKLRLWSSWLGNEWMNVIAVHVRTRPRQFASPEAAVAGVLSRRQGRYLQGSCTVQESICKTASRCFKISGGFFFLSWEYDLSLFCLRNRGSTFTIEDASGWILFGVRSSPIGSTNQVLFCRGEPSAMPVALLESKRPRWAVRLSALLHVQLDVRKQSDEHC